METLATNDFWILGLIVLCPLIGAVINGILGPKMPRQVVWFVACASIGASFALALYSVSAMWSSARAHYEPVPVPVQQQKKQAAEQADGEEGAQAAEEGEANASEHPGLRVVIETPSLRWTGWQWITSGDWTEGDQGYVPAAQFEHIEPTVLEHCCRPFADEPGWVSSCQMQLTNCLAGAYTPDTPVFELAADGKLHVVREAQGGIGGVRAKLDSGSHRFDSIDIGLELVMDALAAVLVLIITGVGFLIHLYSVGYMRHDDTKSRYFAYLNLFCFAMLMLVLGGNLVVMFVGWEGVGLCSYLLIGYYYESHENADAGKKAFIVNRVGDFAFMIGVMTLFFAFGTLDFSSLEAMLASGAGPQGALLTLSCILIFVGCTGKSAQIPLYTWLPDAMAGPTPVSALIHAATMVTAGVYLVARLNFLFVHAPVAMMVVAFIGATTALFAATIALVQTDIKKVLAYSTVSQLGYMFLAVGVGAWWVAIFHLMTHAFFKALLFLGSGSVIDAMHHEQDIRKMGGLRKLMPVTAITFLIGTLAIAGVPLLSGFFSKDQILWYAWYNQFPGAGGLSWILWGMGTLTAALTAFYMFRLYFLTFEGECRAEESVKKDISESPTSMLVPLVVLAILSVIGGYVGLPHLLSFGYEQLEVLQYWLAPVLDAAVLNRGLTEGMTHDSEVAWEIALMSISVVAALGGIVAAWFLYIRNYGLHKKLAESFAPLHKLLTNKYYVDEIYDRIFVRGTLWLARISHRVFDNIIIDFLIVRGAAWAYERAGNALKYFQNGDLQRYAAYIVLGIVAVIYLVMF